jgi:hypothetical protein
MLILISAHIVIGASHLPPFTSTMRIPVLTVCLMPASCDQRRSA